MAKSAEGITGEMNEDLAALQKEITRLADLVGSFVQDKAEAAGSRVSAAVGDAKDKIASTAADAEAHARAATGRVEACIENNPMKAVLVSFGIGTLLGMMTRWRS